MYHYYYGIGLDSSGTQGPFKFFSLHMILGNYHTYVYIHCAYPEVDNMAWFVSFFFIWIYETLTLQWPWGDLWLTQKLHAHKGPPLPSPTRVHMVSTPCYVDPKLQPSYQNTCISIKWQPLSLGPGMSLRVKGLAQLKLRYEWDRG